MTSRGRQLALELLLLSEKYTRQEVLWATRQLHRSGHRSSEVGIIVATLRELYPEEQSEENHSNKKNQTPEEGSSTQLIERLVSQLETTGASRARRRAESVASRLRVKTLGRSTSDIISDVRRSLLRLDESRRREILSNYKIGSDTDKGYVGLAEYLIRPAGKKADEN